MSSAPSQGSSGDFLNRLRAFESGIDPALHAWYVSNFRKPVLDYPQTSAPGRLVRDRNTGEHIFRSTTVEDYFRALGVLEAFDRSNPASLTQMQYRSVNPWGFVGYQIGEEILIDTGYYEPALVSVEIDGETCCCPRFHRGGLPAASWSGGVVERFLPTSDGGPILATDVNCWEGQFTGKHNVHTFKDLMDPGRQEVVIREIIFHNLRTVSAGLRQAGLSLKDCLKLTWRHENPWATTDYVNCSVSGIIASSHLCGSSATLSLLIESRLAKDDLGTSALDYMARFGNYDLADLLDGAPKLSGDLSGHWESQRVIDA